MPIEWVEEIPGKKKIDSDYIEVTKELQANPGKPARVLRDGTKEDAARLQRWLTRDGFDVNYRTVADGIDVYATFPYDAEDYAQGDDEHDAYPDTTFAYEPDEAQNSTNVPYAEGAYDAGDVPPYAP